ncbi:hypothetical protein A3D03_00390 [Candidatus Gottesmanbacteria bacterium RIFCSPHIGHO2_02_FULL_40_13]|uniref:Uncharacterized protein n=1 Tax=Candidatus Gottesmanbacteria bacterium RIFCSPHIGHO2_02_FULL_40_13 TaxID=1798384 RepID=A0A1F6A7C9_9BACT|nr:MAG: hypothetical protein A3D03_00390 [Candidatus Gottesmanbacteria bacterium RIFCSPHIGHO2_02_FULL_40_13]
MKPKKILILIIAFILLFFLLIILVYRRTGAGIIQEQTLPSPFEEGFDQESTEAQNDFVIKSFLWKKIERGLPENISFLSSSKRSPLGNMTGVIANGQLNIDRDFTRLQKIEVSANISAVNFVWINEQFLIMIEKDKSRQKLDRIYLIDSMTGEKQFFAGSFPITSRLDLNFEPLVETNGKNIYFKDNDGNYWLLTLSY